MKNYLPQIPVGNLKKKKHIGYMYINKLDISMFVSSFCYYLILSEMHVKNKKL